MDEVKRFVAIDVAKATLDVFVGSASASSRCYRARRGPTGVCQCLCGNFERSISGTSNFQFTGSVTTGRKRFPLALLNDGRVLAPGGAIGGAHRWKYKPKRRNQTCRSY